jgi:hypothetical protein
MQFDGRKRIPKIFFRSDAFVTTCVGLFGADSGRFVQGIVDPSGNGYPGGDIVTWQFPAPPYDVTHFEHGITGPDHADIPGVPPDGHVPDVGGTLMLLAVGLGVLFGCRRLRIIRTKETPHKHQGIR